MGRKSRKKFRKSDPKEVEEFSDGEDPEFLSAKRLDKEYELLDRILTIRQRMLDYREEVALPICEFLTPELMIDFVDWVKSEIIY